MTIIKRIKFDDTFYESEKIVKTNDTIVGYNGQNEVFAFRGVSDFTLFELVDGQDFDKPQQTLEDYILELEFRLMIIELGI